MQNADMAQPLWRNQKARSIAQQAQLQICRLPCHKGPFQSKTSSDNAWIKPKIHKKKTVGGWGFAPDPTRGVYDAPPDTLVESSLSAPPPTHLRRVPPHFLDLSPPLLSGSRNPGHDPFLDFSLQVFEILPLCICAPNFMSLALLWR